jgi:hypothetical protein
VKGAWIFFVALAVRPQIRRLVLSLPMNPKSKFKCLHCRAIHISEPRNRGRQRYCPEPECRRASKASSQRQWTRRPENENYFRGDENTERVRQWRKAHPGYWRKKKAVGKDALQETCNGQAPVTEIIAQARAPDALQDICFLQPALLVGLISIVTGHALQEDIAASTRSFLTRGEDILRMTPRSPEYPSHENQTRPLPRKVAACACPI